MKKPNEAARDLWSQIFERAIAAPDAAVHEPDEQTEITQQALVVRALTQAGWSETEIERRNTSENLHIHLETVGNPGVGPGLEFKLSVLADRVRKVISETGEASQEKVEIGIDPKSGVSASLTNVIMTDEGILTVSAFLFRWCGLIARAYTRTLVADLAHWTSPTSRTEDDQKVLLKNPDIVLDWFRIFVSFSGTGTHILVPYRPASPTEFNLFEQVAWAMEFFTVAHEFGHHVLGHRNIDEDPKAQEFQADVFAAKVCERLEFEPFPNLSNPYTRTGAGGSLMLLALEILRSFEDRKLDGTSTDETHPSTIERIERISTRNRIQPKQLEMDQEFNRTVVRMMGAIAAVMNGFYDAGGNELITEMQRKRREAS